MIFSHAYVFSGFKVCAPLAYENLSRLRSLTGKKLHPQILGAGITHIFRRSRGLGSCHNMNIIARAIEFVKRHETDIMLAMGVALISLLSFAAGYLTAREQLKEPIRVEQTKAYETAE